MYAENVELENVALRQCAVCQYAVRVIGEFQAVWNAESRSPRSHGGQCREGRMRRRPGVRRMQSASMDALDHWGPLEIDAARFGYGEL